MNVFEFIIGAAVLFCFALCLIIVIAKCTNIKQIDFKIGLLKGIEITSLFYKK